MLMLLTEAEEVRGKLVWERHSEFNYRQAIYCCRDIQVSAVPQTIRDMSLERRRAVGAGSVFKH